MFDRPARTVSKRKGGGEGSGKGKPKPAKEPMKNKGMHNAAYYVQHPA